MKFIPTSRNALVAAVAALLIQAPVGAAEKITDATELVRAMYQTDRQTLLADELRLTEHESAAFWPLYRSYRADMDKLGDSLVKLVLEYADVYPNVPEERAEKMLKDYADLEEKIVDTRKRYIKRAAKELPATKALRWAQLENRMDILLRLQLASAVPLVPNTQLTPSR
jgi:hypothetical protein